MKWHFEFVDTPLQEAVEFLSKRHNVKIVLADDITDVTKDAKLRYEGNDVMLREALREMLRPHKLTWAVKDEAIHIIRYKNAEKSLTAPSEIEFIDTPLKDGVEFLSEQHKVNIVLAADVSQDTSIRYAGKGSATFGTHLTNMLKPHDLTFEVKDNAIHIIRQKK